MDIFVEVQYDIFKILSPKNNNRSLPPIYTYYTIRHSIYLEFLKAELHAFSENWWYIGISLYACKTVT